MTDVCYVAIDNVMRHENAHTYSGFDKDCILSKAVIVSDGPISELLITILGLFSTKHK